MILKVQGKTKVFYGQEHRSGESTMTVRVVNYQLLAVMLLTHELTDWPIDWLLPSSFTGQYHP